MQIAGNFFQLIWWEKSGSRVVLETQLQYPSSYKKLKNSDRISFKYQKATLLCDMKKLTKTAIKEVSLIHSYRNIIHGKNCFKNHLKPICIDSAITSRPKCFHKSMVNSYERLSDFHKMEVFQSKQKANVIQHQNHTIQTFR